MRLLVLATLGHWINYLCCVAQGAKASSHFPTAGLKKLGQSKKCLGLMLILTVCQDGKVHYVAIPGALGDQMSE